MRTIVLVVALIASLPARHTRAGEADPPQSKTDLLPSVDFDRHVASLLGRLGWQRRLVPRIVSGARRA